eukprot:GSMAST32.ASY1.ANO1.527.1 assembled CDS
MEYETCTIGFAYVSGINSATTTANGGKEAGFRQKHAFLNDLFCDFDRLCTLHGVEKIKTIGKVYMFAGGMPSPSILHAQNVATMSLAIVEKILTRPGLSWKIGIASGKAVAGVIGKSKFCFDVFGDTVNTASRMYSHCPKGRIQITPKTAALLEGQFNVQSRGEIEVKGKGKMETFFLVSTGGSRSGSILSTGDTISSRNSAKWIHVDDNEDSKNNDESVCTTNEITSTSTSNKVRRGFSKFFTQSSDDVFDGNFFDDSQDGFDNYNLPVSNTGSSKNIHTKSPPSWKRRIAKFFCVGATSGSDSDSSSDEFSTARPVGETVRDSRHGGGEVEIELGVRGSVSSSEGKHDDKRANEDYFRDKYKQEDKSLSAVSRAHKAFIQPYHAAFYYVQANWFILCNGKEALHSDDRAADQAYAHLYQIEKHFRDYLAEQCYSSAPAGWLLYYILLVAMAAYLNNKYYDVIDEPSKKGVIGMVSSSDVRFAEGTMSFVVTPCIVAFLAVMHLAQREALRLDEIYEESPENNEIEISLQQKRNSMESRMSLNQSTVDDASKGEEKDAIIDPVTENMEKCSGMYVFKINFNIFLVENSIPNKTFFFTKKKIFSQNTYGLDLCGSSYSYLYCS